MITLAPRNSPDLGVLVIDPQAADIHSLIPFCVKGSPTKCLIGTVASSEIGKRVSVHLNHQNKTGRIGITEGDYRYERELLPDEYAFAAKFDHGNGMKLRKPMRVAFHLNDGTWTRRPKEARGGGNKNPANRNGNGKAATKSHRARSLELWRKRRSDLAA